MEIVLSALGSPDLPAVSELFDASLGSEFWSLGGGSHEYCQVAKVDGALIGAAVATLTDRLDEAPDLRSPVGLVRLVAVRETARRQGAATLLVASLSRICLDADASALASFAWVHGDSGVCALSGVLANLGFKRLRHLESFYADEGGTPCPACRCAPCVCSADLYVRE